MTFRMTQVLTRHGCFGEYLYRIGGSLTAATRRMTHNTLKVCVTWKKERRDLVAAVDEDLSLPAVIEAAVGSDTGWRALSSFCEAVMAQKEERERERERTGERRRFLERERREEESSGGDEPSPPRRGRLTHLPVASTDPGHLDPGLLPRQPRRREKGDMY